MSADIVIRDEEEDGSGSQEESEVESDENDNDNDNDNDSVGLSIPKGPPALRVKELAEGTWRQEAKSRAKRLPKGD
jgi:hypothetical protein